MGKKSGKTRPFGVVRVVAQFPRFWLNGAAQESNLPSAGLRRRTGFEDQLGHRPQPLLGGH